MIDLTAQQAAILSEGLCPFCFSSPVTTVSDELGAGWRCDKCKQEFHLYVDDKPHAVSNAQCYLCGHRWVAVHLPETRQLECPKCNFLMGSAS